MSSVYSALRSLYVVSKLLGLAPASWYNRHSICTSIFLQIWTIILILFLLLVLLFFLVAEFSEFGPKLNTRDKIQLSIYVTPLALSCAVILISVSTFRRFKTSQVLSKIFEVDKIFSQKGKELYRNTGIFINLQLLVAVGFRLCLWVFAGFVDCSMQCFFFSPDVLPAVLNTVIIIQFLNLALIMRKKYRILNEFLAFPALEGDKTGVKVISRSSPSCFELSELGELYAKMYDIITLISSAYGVPLLVITLWLLSNIIASATYAVHNNDATELLVNVLDVMTCLMLLLAVTVPSHLAIWEHREASVLIQKALLHRNGPDRVQLERLLSQLGTMKICFSVCGFFSMDLPLVCGIMGLACTYVAVIAQVK